MVVEQAKGNLWLAQRSLLWHPLYRTLEETLRQNPFSTWEKTPVSQRVTILLRTGYIIYCNLHNLLRPGYIICRAPWKMKMWAFCWKEFQEPRASSKHRPGGPFPSAINPLDDSKMAGKHSELRGSGYLSVTKDTVQCFSNRSCSTSYISFNISGTEKEYHHWGYTKMILTDWP